MQKITDVILVLVVEPGDLESGSAGLRPELAARVAAAPEVSPDGYRALVAHDWPKNVRELRVLEEATLAAADGEIGSAEIRTAIRSQERKTPLERGKDERAWILDGLRRNRFRKGETPRFLGVSRKTLYNKMRRHVLLD